MGCTRHLPLPVLVQAFRSRSVVITANNATT